MYKNVNVRLCEFFNNSIFIINVFFLHIIDNKVTTPILRRDKTLIGFVKFKQLNCAYPAFLSFVLEFDKNVRLECAKIKKSLSLILKCLKYITCIEVLLRIRLSVGTEAERYKECQKWIFEAKEE